MRLYMFNALFHYSLTLETSSEMCAQTGAYKLGWSYPSSSSATTFKTPALAQSVLEQTALQHMHPTPPPPGIRSSSSSLANALGPINDNERHESKAFFNNFVEETVKHIPPRSNAIRPRTPPSSMTAAKSSPDPLALPASSPLTPSTITMTPKKRKMVEVVIETPSKKLHLNSPDIKPRSLPSPFKLQPYVQINTPFKYPSTPTSALRAQASSPADLGGYGPIEGGDTNYRKENRRQGWQRYSRFPLCSHCMV